MEEKKEQLYIPLNVRKRKELFAGFGQQELVITSIVLFISFVVGIILYGFTKGVEFLVITPIVCGFVTIIVIVKDQTNTSLLDSIIRLHRFSKSQKRYYYQYQNIYEGEVQNEKSAKREVGSKDSNSK